MGKDSEVVKELKAVKDCSKLVKNRHIFQAAKKPEGVSDVRWRIELRRRKDAEFYSSFGDIVP